MEEINKLYGQIAEHKQYLQSTDYHRLKAAEGNYTVPAEIIELSNFARSEIDRLMQEIKALDEEKLTTEIQDAEVITDSVLAE